MHLKRWLTGIILAPVLIFLIIYPYRLPFYVFIYITSLAALIEFYTITDNGLPKSARWSIYLVTLSLFVAVYTRQILLTPFIFALWAFVPMAICMFTRSTPSPQWTSEIGKAVLGPIYVGIPLSMLLHIDRFYPEGARWVLFLLTVIFGSDTGAFYFGRFFGKHKLHESISPGKTWEGAIGGLLSSVIVAFVFLKVIPLHRLDGDMLLLPASLSVAGQIGDLAESMLKRNHGVKDSGRILPGHGGILDRIDGLLFSIPILYIYLSFAIV